MPANRSPDYKTDEGPRPVDDRSTAAPVLEPNEARQGVTHHNVRRVLAISLAGIVVAYLVIYFVFFH